MDIRTMLLAAAVLLPGCASAQAAPPSQAEVRALVGSLPQGSEFRSGGRTYRPVAGLRAVIDQGNATSPEVPSARLPGGSVVDAKGAYVIYREPVAPAAAATAATLDRVTANSVVVNTRSGRLGIVNGVLNVDLQDVEAAQAIADQYGLVVDRVATGIGAAFFRAPPGTDLRAVAARLARDPRVKSVDLDIKEDFPVPN
jgi:hypothetical protein